MLYKLGTCRCCLTAAKPDDELYEFSSEVSVDEVASENPSNFVKIFECWKAVTNLIDENEERSERISRICSQCLGDLKFSYIFQKKCLDSDKDYVDLPDHHYEVSKAEDIIKMEEPESPTIEYVQEEFIDEDTNDGFEDENGLMHEEGVKHEKHGAGSMKFSSALESHSLFQQDSKKSKKPRHVSDDEEDSELCYKCKKCNERFISKADAREHLQKSHSNDEKCFNCLTCSKSFKNRYQLILHNRTHTGEKPFECPVCHRCFSLSSNLQKHLDTHSTEKNYICQICSQLFKTQRSLKFHTASHHQPEAKVKCTLCDKTFVNKSYLKMHMLYHTGEKNYTCSICNGKYYKSSHLKRHVQNVHFKLRLMKCDYCASDFVRKETYKSHIISHHKRQLSEAEFQQVLEKIKNFQPPSLDVKQYTLEKQNMQAMADTEAIGELEMIEEDEIAAEDGMEDEETYYEETEVYEDEQ